MRQITESSKAMTIAVLLTMGLTSMAHAQDDDLLADTEAILNSEQINLEGDYMTPRKELTAAERMNRMRRKLEQQNESMVQKKIEDIRIREEQKLTKKLRRAFSGGRLEDEVPVVQAAPKKIVAPVPVIVDDKDEMEITLTPSFGVQTIQGDKVDYESKILFGLAMDSMVSPRFAVGVGFEYSTMEITDSRNFNSFNNNGSFYNSFFPYNGFNGFNGIGFNNFNNFQGRELTYKRFTFEVNGKFYLVAKSRIRPYLGMGVGYNRVKLAYTDPSNNFLVAIDDDQSVSSSYVSGQVLLGTRVVFNEVVGANVEIKYARPLTTGVTRKEVFFNNQLDEARLESIEADIEESSFVSITAGLSITF